MGTEVVMPLPRTIASNLLISTIEALIEAVQEKEPKE